MNLVELQSVAKRYKQTEAGQVKTWRALAERRPTQEVWALRDISFAIAPGETLGLLGANGSGKSTLLRLLAGLTRPSHGRILLRARTSGLLTIGEGFQSLLSAEENAFTGAILAGLSRREARRRLAEVAEFSELETHMDQPLRTFSDGMRLRLAFAASLMIDPEILLIDEVLAVGDLRFREKCMNRLEQFRAAGVTVIVASHELDALKRFCDRSLWLADGEVRAVGHTEEVIDRYRRAMGEGVERVTNDPRAPMRLGSRKVEIVDVRLLGHDGTPVQRIPSGAGLDVEMDFVAHEPVPDAVFGVSVHSTGDGIRCLDVSTESDGHSVGPLEGEGRIRLHLERVDLSGGTYNVDVGVYAFDWSEPYDYLWEAMSLEVAASPTPGILGPPRRWTMT